VATRFSAPVQTGPGVHPASCTMGNGSFPRVKSGRGVTLTPHPSPLLLPWSRKSRAIPLLSYGPYGLYRASVPVQGCTLPFSYLCSYLYHLDMKRTLQEITVSRNTAFLTLRNSCLSPPIKTTVRIKPLAPELFFF
jgi:hypothetical protein